MPTPEEFIASARSFLGVRFRHQGRSRERGVDCSGLLVLSLQEIGVAVRDQTGYSPRPDGLLLDRVAEQADPVLGESAIGDILVFESERGNGEPQHLGIRTGIDPPTMIHAYCNGLTHRGSVVEVSLDERWTSRLIGAFRHPEIQ